MTEINDDYELCFAYFILITEYIISIKRIKRVVLIRLFAPKKASRLTACKQRSLTETPFAVQSENKFISLVTICNV